MSLPGKCFLLVATVLASQFGCTVDSSVAPIEPVAHIPAVTLAMTAITPVEITTMVNTLVTPAPTVRVTDRNGQPVAGFNVSFHVTGGGTITHTSVDTDISGRASVGWTLSKSATLNTVTALGGTLPPIQFRAVAGPGRLALITPVAGANQTGLRGSRLNVPLKVRLTDSFDNPIAGATVVFNVAFGAGAIESPVAISDVTGVAASGPWTLGLGIGSQQVTVHSAHLQILFTAHSQDCPPGSTQLSCASVGALYYTNRGDGQIYRIETDGTGLQRLTDSGTNSRPILSPDGKRIAFGRTPPAPGAFISDTYVMDADGSNVIRLTEGMNLWSAVWSPDGKKLAVSPEGVYDSDVYLLEVEGGKNVTMFIATARTPAWSPDGRHIAFVRPSGDDGYDEIFLANADGTGARPLTNGGGGIHGLSWSPDGRLLAYSKCKQGGCDLYIMNADGNFPRQLTHTGKAQGAAWSPDGKYVAFTISDYLAGGREWLPTIAFVAVEGGSVHTVGSGYWPSWAR